MTGRAGVGLLSVVVVACGLLSLVFWDRPDFLIDSDTLLPAAFFWDALHHGYAWSGFQQARVPSLFPDLLIYGMAQVMTGSWRAAMAIWVVVVIVWLVTVASWITARVARSGREVATLAVLLLVMLVLMASALRFPWFPSGSDSDGNIVFPYLFIFRPVAHGGPFLLVLTAVAVASRALDRPGTFNMVGLAVISWAAAVSDLLYVDGLLVPLAATLVGGLWVGTVTRGTAVKLLSVAWGSAALGWLCAKLLNRQPLPLQTARAIEWNVYRFLSHIGHQPSMMIVWGSFALLLASDVRRRGLRGWIGNFWSVVPAVSVLCSLAMLVLFYDDTSSYRYALPFLWWTVILAAAELARVSQWRPALLRLPVGIIIAGIASVVLTAGLHVPRLLRWDSPLASCLQNAGLRAGFAEFWTAAPTSAASDWKLQVLPITQTGAAIYWGNDRFWYTHDIHDGSHRPPNSFIVMDGLSESRIATVYGKPGRVMMCGASVVWVYDDPDRLYQGLVSASPALAGTFASAPAN